MNGKTGTAITYEDLMNIVVEMTYQRAKPLFEEYVRVRNQRLETIIEMVACLVQEVEAACGITHESDEDVDEGDTEPDEAEEPDDDEIIPAD